MDDFFKNLKGDPVVNFENSSNLEPKLDETNLLVQNKAQENIIVQQKDDPVLNAIKKIDIVAPDGSGMHDKIKELTDENKKAIEELRSQSKTNTTEENAVIITGKSDSINKLLGKLDPPDVHEINEKLNEITEQSQAAIEDLRSQSTKIIDQARAQTNKVLENAKVNFSVFTKALEDELEPEQSSELDPPKTPEQTFDELVERYSSSGNIMDFFN